MAPLLKHTAVSRYPMYLEEDVSFRDRAATLTAGVEKARRNFSSRAPIRPIPRKCFVAAKTYVVVDSVLSLLVRA